jgi:predicted transcriptional regulator
MLSRLAPRERQVVDLLYERGGLTVADICDALPGRPSGSAVRTMLTRLERKGFVARAESDRGYVFSPAVSNSRARKAALQEIVRVFFEGSPVGAASALLGMSRGLSTDELDQLERLIADARKERAG